VAYSIGRACGPAVTRNRLRRRIRDILRRIDQTTPLPTGMLLIGARLEATKLTFDQLTAEVEALMASLSP
jgi:ribonuclease P protein component